MPKLFAIYVCIILLIKQKIWYKYYENKIISNKYSKIMHMEYLNWSVSY